METIHTSNQHENSVTIARPDGSKIDFCHMDNEVIIGETKGDEHTQIVLTPREAIELAEHIIISVVSA